jgi:subtilisin-like proprotein convertase family protein
VSGANGFERAAAGDYPQGHYFDGWTVVTNQVTVISNTTLAYAGTNLLALADGTISRILPTVPGQTYILSYAYRGPGLVSMWKGENNANDSIDGNNGVASSMGYTHGVVGEAFVLNGSSSQVYVPASANLNVGIDNSGFTLETWVNPASATIDEIQSLIQWNQSSGSGAGPIGAHLEMSGSFDADLHLNVIDTTLTAHSFYSPSGIMTGNTWQHVAATYDGVSGNAVIYRNGVVVAQANLGTGFTPRTDIDLWLGTRPVGSFANHFKGMLDESSVYNRPLSASEILAIYQKGSLGKYNPAAPSIAQGLAEAQVTVGGTPFPLFYGNNTNWQTTNITFSATQSNTVLQVAGLEPGMLLDSFVLTNVVVTVSNWYSTNTTVWTNTATNGFEGAVAGDYPQGQMFDGWVETCNQVTVISNAALAFEDTNLLALADGTVTRILPTLPGQTYTLSYAYRGPGAVGLWRAENNTDDSINGNNPIAVQGINYTAGEVRQAFQYDGSTSLITVPPSTSLAVSNLTIDAWVYPTDGNLRPIVDYGGAGQRSPIQLWINTTGGTSVTPGGIHAVILDPSGNGFGVDDYNPDVNVNQWNHLAFTVNTATETGVLYCNGVLVPSSVSGTFPASLASFVNVNIGYRDQNSAEILQGYRFLGNLDEVSIYNRDLSASEIQAIWQKGSSGKYDTNAPSIAQGLAEAQVSVDGVSYPPPLGLFYGDNANWQTNTITFTTSATQSNSVLQITGLEPGMLLDDFILQQQVITTTTNTSTVLNGGDIYYLPEQSLDTYTQNGENSYGQWQLEVWDNRAGAGLTNTLVSWQLRFNFATAVSSIGTLANGTTLTNIIAAGSIQYYTITVPANADIATNLLLYATNSLGTFTPLNVWFNQTTPPSGTNSPGDFLLIAAQTNGTAILDITGTPPLVPGSTYYIAIQNTNGIGVNFGFQVDFHLIPAPIVLTNGLPQINTLPGGGIAYYLINVPTNADWATNLLLFANGPLNVWFNPTNLPVGTNPPDILLCGGATNGISIFGTNTIPTNIVPGGTYYLAVQNPGTSNVTYGIEVDFHLVFSIPAGGIVFYPVNVPTNADFATNILVFATGPLNIWYDTNNPPTTNILLLPNAAYPGGTNGSVVLSAGTTPPLVPGSTYWIGVQNTNSFAVTYALEVDFHLISWFITGPTITYTNIGGTNGYLLQWQGPLNFQYEIQWTTNLLPPVVWHTVLNPVINVVVTTTNGHFSFFDDGSLTGGWSPLKFYRILGGLNLGPIPGSAPATNTVLAGAMSQAVVTVPANALWASNVLLSATGPLNVWFNQTNPPTGNTNAGDRLMLSAASAGVFVLTSNSVPPLVPGTNYYLGFQNPGTSNVTFVFQVTFGYPVINPVSNFSITATNGGIWLKWNGLTNYLYQVQWTTNLAPPSAWNTVSNILLSSTTGVFTFFDNGSLTGGFGPLKFYRLIAWPLPPTPQTLSFSSVTITNLGGTNDLMLQWSAPANYQYGIQWTTNLVLPFSNWSLIVSPVLTLTNGVYTFIDNGQTGPPAGAKYFRLFEY